MIFVGVDWAEAHHDVCVLDNEGKVLARKRVADSFACLTELHALVANHLSDDDDVSETVVVGIEKDRGLIVTSLITANYQVFAVNPLAAARYRERHHVSGAKSDPGDAKVLADLVRTDRHNHRRVAGDSNLAEAVKLLARAHQNAIWSRQRQVNALRSSLKDYFPGALLAFGTDLSIRFVYTATSSGVLITAEFVGVVRDEPTKEWEIDQHDEAAVFEPPYDSGRAILLGVRPNFSGRTGPNRRWRTVANSQVWSIPCCHRGAFPQGWLRAGQQSRRQIWPQGGRERARPFRSPCVRSVGVYSCTTP